MARSTLDRKKLFRMALAADGKTAEQWAIENGFHTAHLSLYWAGRDKPEISAKVDTYIAQTFKAYRIKVAA